ncbi:MAG: TOBE domain-containing protein [Pseudomonadota bacterium]|nr:TOBE domain-containing protein [Pseudomonadota bacterium]
MDAGNGATFKKRWMDLLASLQAEHSITAAAKAVGLSYKAAWDAIATMNNLSGRLLVERSVGGKGGGGAKLTARGLRLVETFRAVEAENTRFVERVNRRVRDNADLKSMGRMTMMTSARNHFSGKVSRISRGAVNDEVELKLPGGAKIVAIITHESTEVLGLKKGVEAIALIKASWIIVSAEASDRPLKLSARNQLRGTVSDLSAGAINTEVVIALKGGLSVAAIITKASADAMGLAVGKPATAIFKASSVILGVAG